MGRSKARELSRKPRAWELESRERSSPFPPFPWKTLRGPLQGERARVREALRSLLRFQRDLARFRPVTSAPDATPFVSLYAEGNLRGCRGSGEGTAAERLVRAFLHAQDDDRFGGLSAAQRAVLTAQVSYPRSARLQNPHHAEDEIEPGTHGVALIVQGRPTLLLPHVARDEHMSAPDLLRALARKAGLPPDAWADGALYLFETEDVVARDPEPTLRRRAGDGPEALAAAFLSSLVAEDGRVTFAIDPRTRQRIETGEMHHGRAAVAVQALAASGRYPAVVARARRRLDDDLRAALRGHPPPSFPAEPAAVAGTLALAVLAGAGVTGEPPRS